MRKTIGLLALVLAAGTTLGDTKFSLTGKNTKIEFVGSKAEGKHDGGFKTVTGSATASGKDASTLKVSLDIDTTSLWADNPKLTAHLKSPDFFGVKKHPKAKFVTTKVVKGAKGYTITGELTLLGKTKSITCPADITLGDDKLTIKSTFKIDRTDFGMTYGKGKVYDEVTIKVSVNASK
jgi:polyisoprenoid-binding protein YceI